LLREALAWFECKVVNEYPAGDHVLLLGKVVGGKLLDSEAEPMSYRQTVEMDGANARAWMRSHGGGRSSLHSSSPRALPPRLGEELDHAREHGVLKRVCVNIARLYPLTVGPTL
jgi:hypothetical protein